MNTFNKATLLRGSAIVLIAAVGAIAAPSSAQESTAPADAAQGENQGDVIVVSGRRQAIESAASQERDSDMLKSVVTADDIGQFGDPTVAETLQRISGVSINRENGEGQQVSIRGLPTEFATVTIDGARLGTSDGDINSSRLDIFSADNLGQIEVTKTLTPEQDADAIAGSIELKTNSAFRRGRDSLGFRAELGYDKKADSYNPKFSGDFTKILDLANGDRLGLAGSLSWSKRETFTDDTRADDGLIFVVNNRSLASPKYGVAEDCSNTSTVECYLRPREFDYRAEIRDVKRLSATGSLEYETGGTVLELRGSYASQMTDRYNNRQTFSFERSTKSKEILALGPDFGDIVDSRTERRLRPGTIDNKIYSIGFDGRTDAGDGWTVTYGGYFASNRSDTNEAEARFRADDVRLTYENLGRSGIEAVLSQEASNEVDPAFPESYTLNGNRINQRFTTSTDRNWAVFYDIEHKFSLFGNDAEIQVGAKYRNREREFDFNRLETFVASGSLADVGPLSATVDRSNLAISFDPKVSDVRRFIEERLASGSPAGTEIGNFAVLESLANDYSANEDILAGYVQFTVHPMPNMQVITGFRVETTDFKSTGSRVRDLSFNDDATDVLTDALMDGGVSDAIISDFAASRLPNAPVVPFSGGNGYVKFLPSINVRWEPAEDIVVRASYTVGLKRPEFREAAAVQQFRTQENGLDENALEDVINNQFGGQLTSVAQANQAIAASLGGVPQFVTDGENIRDPGLNPLISKNFDLSVGWYPSRNTVLSVSGFYKKISNFIFPVGVSGGDVALFGFEPDDGTVDGFGVDRFNTYVNGDQAKIYGVELGVYQAFRFLPKPLDGFFVEGNLTLADSEATAPLVDRTFRFPDQSNLIGNLSIGWENDTLSLRAAGVYQGSRLRGLNQAQLDDSNDRAGDILEEDRFQLDFSARLNVTPAIQIYADAINVTNAHDLRFYRGGNTAQNGSLFARIEDYGATYQIGVRAKF